MNLLMITRKVDRDDSHAGHTYAWVRELARQLGGRSNPLTRFEANHPLPAGRGVGGEGAMKQLGSLTVLCLQKGNVDALPDNVRIVSLGKERGVGRIGRWLRFVWIAPGLVRKADAIFCHQNPEYTIAVWPWAKLFRKRVVTWYTHGTVTWKTRAVARMADVILTASAASFRVPSPKVVVTGHGIDLEQFAYQLRTQQSTFHIVSVGRISPTKDYETLIQAVALLRKLGAGEVAVSIIGEPGLPQQVAYQESLKQLVVRQKLEDIVQFIGPVPNREVVRYYQTADAMVNLSRTGSVDKAVLEAMACGCLVVTSNPAFSGIVGSEWVIAPNDPSALAGALRELMAMDAATRQTLGHQLRSVVERDHNLTKLVGKIVAAAEGNGDVV